MFNLLCQKLRRHLEKQSRIRQTICLEHRVAVAVYFLATTGEYRTIANLFGIHKSTVCCIVHEVCNAIYTYIFPAVVKFPEGEELKRVISGFQKKWNFPNCGGAIDATHIPIVAPQQFHSDYVNRKGFYSIIMQAVCDDKYRFTDVCIGWPGRVHDARVFSNSKLRALVDGGEILPQTAEMMVSVGLTDQKVDMPVVIIADPAYPMCPWLLKPYSNRGALTEEQSYFNYRLSSARMTIENTFGRFKGRWRRLSKRIDVDVEFVPVLTAASVALHNMCENEHELFDPDWLQEVDAETGECGHQVHPDPVTGSALREALTAQFASERQ
ncbi:uncharacterized protein [Haliotis asinina]|uniref:uncharacterized protein n=1 Tax=Haliotis asinina TaxID=109174 RepID=UPI003531FD8C